MNLTLLPGGQPVGVDFGAAGGTIANQGAGSIDYSDTLSPFVVEGTVNSAATSGTLTGVQFLRSTTGAVAIVTLNASSSASGTSTSGRGDVPEGGQIRATGRTARVGAWQPNTVPGNPGAGNQMDVTFAPVVQNEADVLAQGGRLNNNYLTYFAATKAALANGPQAGKAMDVQTVNGVHAVFTLDGTLSMDEWTVEVPILSVGADLTAQPAGGRGIMEILAAMGGFAPDSIRVGLTTNTGVIEARYLSGGVTLALAQITVVAGEVPADTWITLSMTWKRSQTFPLRLVLGNNLRTSASGLGSAETGPGATPLPLLPMTGGQISSGTGIALGGQFNFAPSTSFRVGMPTFRRYQMTYNTELNGKGPTIAVDASSTSGAMPDPGGVLHQYQGWTPTGHDSSTAIRDALCAMAGAAGMRLARIEHIFDKAIITGSGAAPVYDWTPVWEIMDPLASAGIDKFHLTLGYTPSILGATQATPPSNNTQFANICLAFMQAAAARYGTSKLYSWSLWNEPDLVGFWSGSTAQLTALWQAVHTALEPAFPTVLVGATENGGWSTAGGASAKLRDIIDTAATDGRRLDFITYHDYTGDLGALRRMMNDAQAYVDAKSNNGNFNKANARRVAIPEWNWSLQDYGQFGSQTSSLAAYREPPSRTEKLAAHAYAYLVEFNAAGGLFTSFARLGVTTAGSPNGAEAHLGMFSLDNPPKPYPVFAAFQALWKLQGTTKISATSNWPSLRALAGKLNGVVTVTYGTWKPGDPTSRHPVNFEWSNLPTTFTWKHWQIDRTNYRDGRLQLIAEGTQANLPHGVEIGNQGVGAIQITPS